MIRYLAIIVVLCGVVAVGLAQPADAKPQRTPPVAAETTVRYGAAHCKLCHEKANPDYEKLGVYKLIVADCSSIWEKRDPHAQAFNRLKSDNDLARKMSNVLGYDVSKQAECLACHAVDLTPTAAMAEKKFAWTNGVGCEACHGIADKWQGQHFDPAWRQVDPAEKTKLGLVDLRDPATRAAKCVTCHVGSMSVGKFVTHEMYAAGHPPLLPFEAATFGRDQPAHWRPPEDTPYIRILKPEESIKYYHAPPGELWVPRAVAFGAIVTLRDSVRLVAQAAERSGDSMLDFAHYDCFACHHELELPSRRQLRGYAGTPGRPIVRPLPIDLVAAVLAHAHSTGGADHSAEIHASLMELNSAFDRRPFGDPPAIATAGNRLVGIMDTCLGDLQSVHYDEAGRQKLLTALLATGKPALWDYDVAQQQAWAARTLSGQAWPELGKSVLLNAGIPPDANVQKLLKDRLKLRYGFDPAVFSKTWATLR